MAVTNISELDVLIEVFVKFYKSLCPHKCFKYDMKAQNILVW